RCARSGVRQGGGSGRRLGEDRALARRSTAAWFRESGPHRTQSADGQYGDAPGSSDAGGARRARAASGDKPGDNPELAGGPVADPEPSGCS
ncbi:MAG: hypothetical protein ACREQ8_14930, partial [Woeseiaceae bacterium]